MRPGAVVDGLDSAFVTDRLSALTHELANLLDGSLRCVSLARREAVRTAHAGAGAVSPERFVLPNAQNERSEEPDLDLIRRHLETVHVALVQMSQLVRSSMSGFTPGLMAPVNLSLGSCGSLADAVRHAVDVMQPLANDQHIRLVCDVDHRLGEIPAGPVYTVVSSGVRNAIESIQRASGASMSEAGSAHRGAGAGEGERGVVHVLARLDDGVTPEQVLIEILDDGEGPIRGADGSTDQLFEFGVSTKPRGTGIGLAVTRDVIHELGGSVTLRRRRRDETRANDHDDPARPGAVLAVRFPCPPAVSGDADTGDANIG
ncbi:MAG: HAMP domain-containing histidine kinase [Phycisphaeraceae bacterium]|nr:HAMP domain-containing histidine kinase [Phycisphaeraceae bacterium]